MKLLLHGTGGVDLAGILADAGADPEGFLGEWWGWGMQTGYLSPP